MSLKKETAAVGLNKPQGGIDPKKRITTISWIPFKENYEFPLEIRRSSSQFVRFPRARDIM